MRRVFPKLTGAGGGGGGGGSARRVIDQSTNRPLFQLSNHLMQGPERAVHDNSHTFVATEYYNMDIRMLAHPLKHL
jgi:hypothetical protein